MEILENIIITISDFFKSFYVSHLEGKLMLNLIIVLSTVLFGFIIYLLSFKNRKNPRLCSHCGTKADLFDYDCNNKDCHSPLLQKKTLFIISGLFIIAFWFLLSTWTKSQGLFTNIFSSDIITFDLLTYIDRIWVLPRNSITEYIFKINIVSQHFIFIGIALIILNLSILSFITERKFWITYFVLSSIIIYSIIFSNYDYFIILFSILWFTSFFKFLKRMRKPPLGERRVDKFAGFTFKFADYLIVFLLYLFLIVGFAETFASFKNYSTIFTFIIELNEKYYIFQIKKILTTIGMLMLIRDFTSVFYFDMHELKKVISSSRSFNIMTMSGVVYLFLNKFANSIVNSITKYTFINVFISTLLSIYFSLLLVLQIIIIFALNKFENVLFDYWYWISGDVSQLMLIIACLAVVFVIIILIINRLYAFINLMIFYLLEAYVKFSRNTEKIYNVFKFLKQGFENMKEFLIEARANITNLNRTMNVSIAVILSYSWVVLLIIAILSIGFQMFQMEKYFIIFILLSCIAFILGRLKINRTQKTVN